MKMNLILAGLLVSAPAHAAIVSQDLANKMMAVGDDGKTLFLSIVDRIKNENFASLEQDLNTFLNTAKAFVANQNNMNMIKTKGATVLQALPMSYIPTQYQDLAKGVQQDAQNVFPQAVEFVATNLPRLGADQVHTLIQGLRVLRAKAPGIYADLQDDIQQYYNTTLTNAKKTGIIDLFNAQKARWLNKGPNGLDGLQTVQSAERIITDLIQGKDIDSEDLPTLAAAYTQLSKLMPLVPMFVRGTLDLINKINARFDIANKAGNVVNGLPQNLRDTLDALRKRAMAFEGLFMDAYTAVRQAVLKATQG